VREDSGVYEGWTVPLDYDPMLSKLIVHAPDRATAIARMRRALDEYFVGGIKTNLPLFRRILEHPDFVAARIDTGFLDRLLAGKLVASDDTNGLAEIAAVSAALFAAMAQQKNGQSSNAASAIEQRADASAWKRTARSEGVRSE
jgi:acetyl-CoA carboxylase biotin carboxylase subunit